MKYPILYSANTTEFNNMGIGALTDTISCICTQDAGDYEIEMTYPITGIHYGDICHSAFIKAVVPPLYETSPQLFRVYRITKPINGVVTINAEHIYHQLSFIPVKQFTATTLNEFFTRLKANTLENCPFTFSTNMPAEHINFKVYNPTSVLNLLGTDEGRLQYLINGEFVWDNYNVIFKDQAGKDNGVEFRYGVNITDINQEENILETVTGVCPYWRGYTSGDNVNTVLIDEKVLHSANAANFPYQRTIPLDCSDVFEEPPTSEEMKEYALFWMEYNQIGYPEVSIELDAADISADPEYAKFGNLFKADLYDTVTVIFPKLGIKKKAKVIKTEYDVLLQRYNTYTIGDIQRDLSASIASVAERSTARTVSKVSSEFDKKLEHQAALLNGALGGHVVINKSNEGYPNEILIMDTDDKATAVNVLRINMNGIAFSTSGYNGPYNTAWTIDGSFVADYIGSGTINAIDITGSNISGSRFASQNGDYLMQMWAAQLSLYNEQNLRATLFETEESAVLRMSTTNSGSDTSQGWRTDYTPQGITAYYNGVSRFYLLFKEDGGFSLTQMAGNSINVNSNGITITDNDGHAISMRPNYGITITDGNNHAIGMYSNNIDIRNTTSKIIIQIHDTNGLGIWLNNVGYTNLGWVDDGNGHHVLGK